MMSDEHAEHQSVSGAEARAGGSTDGATLIRAGSALILLVWLLFELILDAYSFANVTLLMAVAASFAMWVKSNRPGAAWPVPYEWTLRALGYGVGFMGLVELLFDLRFGILDDLGNILGGLGLYAGAFLMFYGARQVEETG